MSTTASPNAEYIDTWNEILVPKFVRFRRVLTTGFKGHSDAAIARHGPKAGDRVLDVGCGFGETSIELAEIVGSRGRVTGIDCCEAFLEVGRADADRVGLSNVTFEVADAQTRAFEPKFDLVFARFGTMFFQSPKAAMRNLRGALVPGGRLVMTVWRPLEANEWAAVPKKIAASLLPPPPDTGRACGPGPFSMADPDTVREILKGAGWSDVTFEQADVPITVGKDTDEAMAFALQLGPAGEIVREAGELGEAKRPEIEAKLRETLEPMKTPAGIVMSSSSWIVTARA